MSFLKRISDRVKDLFEKDDSDERVLPGLNFPLRKAMYKYSKQKSRRNLDTLSAELTKAVFLVPRTTQSKAIPKKKVKAKTAAKKAKKKKEAEAPIVLMYVQDERGRILLPAFSHSSEVKAYFQKEVSTLSVPASDLWKLGLMNEKVAGVVIDPASLLWILSRDHLEGLSSSK
ncbi:hypothetical protein CH373_13975 [Leptospira perolatii]|uniref:SseB protein N-terminal domain-containing protein n=1 Tax=Leptospira perolatii TaxID=2023191 RepID=A0A2M9ZKJ2_9LEPT|nr:SseB family protein [Leptospira perolatii]PJZ69376.1 hypothetical protein CH360_11540 [Leptospira perolatii]PJZ72511.1 hypothetical protein CH373_13975 [Leptospira perolatii]